MITEMIVLTVFENMSGLLHAPRAAGLSVFFEEPLML